MLPRFTVSIYFFDKKCIVHKLFSAPDIRKAFIIPNNDEETTIVGSRTSRAGTADLDQDVSAKSTTSKSTKTSKARARDSPKSDNGSDLDYEMDNIGSDSDDDEDDEDIAEPIPKKPSAGAKTDPTSKRVPVVDLYKDWNNGESLTPEQCAEVMALGSNYERAQMMNKLRNSRMIEELDIRNTASRLFDKDLKGDKPKEQAKGKVKAKAKAQSSDPGARRTTRG